MAKDLYAKGIGSVVAVHSLQNSNKACGRVDWDMLALG